MPQSATVLWVLDLDGVVWLAGRPISGSAHAVERLREAGEQVAFLTNNSGPTLDEHLRTLAGTGIEASPEELVTSAQAAASILEPGSTATVVGGQGIHEALAQRGVTVVAPGDHPDAVVVGRSPVLSYDELARAATAIRGGARFVGTNSDATFPTPDGPLPGAGAVLAFIEVAAGHPPEVAGKPHEAVASLVHLRFGPVGVMVGDRPDTDGRFASLVGGRFALVLSGITQRSELPVTPTPDLVADDLAGVVDQLVTPG